MSIIKNEFQLSILKAIDIAIYILINLVAFTKVLRYRFFIKLKIISRISI